MPTLITHVNPPGPHCRQALTTLQLPHLSALLRLLKTGARIEDEGESLSPLHERLHAQALGLATPDGLLPWAAWQAHTLGLAAPAGESWAWLTPCHWQVNADHVRMANPLDCQISAEESQQVMAALQGFLSEDGITLQGLHHGNWLAHGAVFRDLPTASLARAAGGAVDRWLPRQQQAQTLRKLQNELQMLLYTHPVNDARAARGLLPITSFWVSGTGALPAGFQASADINVHSSLREPGQRDDAVAWTQAWQALDAGPLHALLQQAQSGHPTELTLCGESAAQTFTLQQSPSLWARLQQRVLPQAGTDLATRLQSL
jgi:hypothetical protein